mgnify:CR=1 FL=1
MTEQAATGSKKVVKKKKASPGEAFIDIAGDGGVVALADDKVSINHFPFFWTVTPILNRILTFLAEEEEDHKVCGVMRTPLYLFIWLSIHIVLYCPRIFSSIYLIPYNTCSEDSEVLEENSRLKAELDSLKEKWARLGWQFHHIFFFVMVCKTRYSVSPPPELFFLKLAPPPQWPLLMVGSGSISSYSLSTNFLSHDNVPPCTCLCMGYLCELPDRLFSNSSRSCYSYSIDPSHPSYTSYSSYASQRWSRPSVGFRSVRIESSAAVIILCKYHMMIQRLHPTGYQEVD